MPISLRLSEADQKRLDDAVAKGGYKDRSEALRDALSLLASELDAEANEKITITMRKADFEKLRRARILK